MLGLGGVLGLYPLGEVELGAPSVPGTFVPHTGAVVGTNAADGVSASASSDAVASADSADTASGDALRLGAVSDVAADGVESEVTTE